jgi:pyruvate dehydrogenase E1 component alpha subunit
VADLTPSEPDDFATAPVNAGLSAEEKRGLLRTMVRIRRFEAESVRQYCQCKMAGFLCLYNGQEAVAVGCASVMTPEDHCITNHRCHGHALAAGMTMNECMAEQFGKATGCSKGKGGSLRFFAPSKHFWGGHDLAGAHTPLGLGLAFALKYKGIQGAAVCTLGDGAVNQGCFYESLNMAALFELPVVYVIENNGYSMGTSQVRSSAFKACLAERAEGFGIAWARCDGTDVYEVRAAVHAALERARTASKPMVLEIATYRFYGFSVADAKHDVEGGYRSLEEVKFYKAHHDPIQIFKERLIAEGVLTEEAFAAAKADASAEAEAAAQFADASAFPVEAAMTENVYFEVDHGTEAGRTGRHFFTRETRSVSL